MSLGRKSGLCIVMEINLHHPYNVRFLLLPVLKLGFNKTKLKLQHVADFANSATEAGSGGITMSMD